MMFKIAILPGDGIGPEVMEQAQRVLNKAADIFGFNLECQHAKIGGQAYDECYSHFPDSTKEICNQADAILLGSIGGPSDQRHQPKWKNCEANALLALRKEFQFYGNLRPSKVYPSLKDSSPLKDCRIPSGLDLVVIRELLGDLYFGKHETKVKNGEMFAMDQAQYSESQIRDITRLAIKVAGTRKGHITSIDKANVLDTSKLWREIVEDEVSRHPDISVTHMFVDSAAMELVRNPSAFDVLLCPNMFGDILSDIASVLPGSLGMLPSASFSHSGKGLYEPAGGSAPDIAGQGIANPGAQILSAALMLRYSMKHEASAALIEKSVEACLDQKILTKDLSPESTWYSTEAFTNQVLKNMDFFAKSKSK